MTFGARKAALLFAALALALFAAGSWNLAHAHKSRMTVEERIYHYATVTPGEGSGLLCPKRPAGAWLRLAIAQQADGGKWIIKCAY
jgi:hypothetical protein